MRGRGLGLLLLFLSLISWDAAAQGRPGGRPGGGAGRPAFAGEITGAVQDAATADPIGTATIAVWRAADSTLVTGAVTDAQGRFRIEQLRPGRYYVQVSFIGYATQTVDGVAITPQAPRADFGTIGLAAGVAELDEVAVTAEREAIEFAIDRTVYNTRDQLASAGGSATDLLQNIPSVEVDVDGNVSLRGNQNVAVLINGKPAPMRGEFLTAFLQQLPANMIERVEVIPNPSAKYDPEGMAGILNIVLRQDAELGLSGGLTLGAGTGGKYNASGNLNYQKGKISLFTNYGFRDDDRESEGYNFRENRYRDPLTFLEQDNGGERSRTSHVVNTTLDYSLSERSTLSASALMSYRQGANDDLNAYALLGTDRALTGRYDRLTESENDGLNMDYGLTFRRTVEAGRDELTAEARYSRSRSDDDDRYRQQLLALDGTPADDTPALQANTVDARDEDWTFQTDYIRPVGGLKLEAGAKSTLRRIDNTFFSETFDYGVGTYLPDVELNNAFVYDEQVHAAYGILSGGRGKIEAQAGLRVEQALTTFDLETTDEAFDNDYFSVFPSAFLAYKPTQTQQVKLSYSKRIQRPRTRMLNPFATYSDPLNLFVGNPYLEPEYVHAVEAAYQRFSRRGSLSLTPYFRRTVNEMQRYKTVDDSGISTLTFRNFDTSDSYGAEVIASLSFGPVRGFASFNAYKVVTDGSNVEADLSSDALSWSARFNATWQVTERLDVQATYFYRAPTDVAQGRISSFSFTNLALRQKLLGDRASLSLRLSDPLDRMGFRFEVDDENFYQLGERKWESRVAYLTFTYNFGQQPRRTRRAERDGDEGGFEEVGIN